MPLGTINKSNPVNRSHPLNKGRQAWWLGVSGLAGGNRFPDLFGRLHGTLVSSVAWTPSRGRGGEFVEPALNGTSGYIDCGNDASLNPLTAFAYCIKYRFTVNTGTHWLMGRDDNTLGRSYAVGDGSIQIQGSVALNYTNTDLTLYRDVYLIVTGSSASNTVACYLQGQPNGSSTWTAPGAATGRTSLGERSFSGNEGFCAIQVLDASIYNRMLSADEAWTLYAESRAGYPDTLNRVATRFSSASSLALGSQYYNLLSRCG